MSVPIGRACARNHPNTPRVEGARGCLRCGILAQNRSTAKRTGGTYCENGHGLVGSGVAPDGRCTECVPEAWPAALAKWQPGRPEDTWLDWAAVDQALRGLELVRPLTNYELLCALETLRRSRGWDRREACEWMRANTHLGPVLPADDLQHAELNWARQRNLAMLTVTEAITYGYEDCDVAEDELVA